MNIRPLTISFGLVTTTILWESFGNKGVSYVSNKIYELGQALYAAPGYTDWFKPDYVVGVTLASQIFIPACGNHSPIINYAAKSVMGLTYYTPTVLIYEGAKSLLNSFNFLNVNVVKPSAAAISVFSGGLIGSFCQEHISQPLDGLASNTDILAKNTFLIFYTTFSQLIGNAKATEEDFMHKSENAYDLADIKIVGAENQLYNTTSDYV